MAHAPKAPAPVPAIPPLLQQQLESGAVRCLAVGPTASGKTQCATALSEAMLRGGGGVVCVDAICMQWDTCVAQLDRLCLPSAVVPAPPQLIVVHGVEVLRAPRTEQLSDLLLACVSAYRGTLHVFIECPEEWSVPDCMLTVADVHRFEQRRSGKPGLYMQ